ncbi:hypothetical protein RJ639_040358 [Escallonia herrerae]|uniref:Uncharacterized protein n=1 Tax=Escallonia herrerae TaxID=1293975 RepID=A0AA88WFZ1_9ASTE|nr:hypothetical protein RJ639_040358 [Escallonia herrerae]
MPWIKEIARVVDGLSLVAKEAVRRGWERDLQTIAKRVLLSATDLSGLTKGNVRDFSVPIPHASSNKQPPPPPPSVVYFTTTTTKDDPASCPAPPDQAGETPPPSAQPEVDVLLVSPDSPDLNVASDGNSHDAESSLPPAAIPEVAAAGRVISSSTHSTGVVTKRERRRLRERRVPSTPFSRALGFAGLGAGLAWGTIQESAKRLIFGSSISQDKESAISPFLSDKNAERLALALCRMRGAALKLGQMLSIQDESLVPAPILAALDIVRQGADVMPRSQLNQVLNAELGPEWSSKLTSFDYEPMAAASIGQVDREGLLTKSAQFDLSPLFEENKREEKEEMRFATARPASCVISKLEEVAKAVKFGVRLQGLENGGRGNWAD